MTLENQQISDEEAIGPLINLEMEQSVLGSILMNPKALDAVPVELQSEHFYEGVHKRIFDACLSFRDQGKSATPITLRAYFQHDEAMNQVGGAQAYLAGLGGMALPYAVRDYAQSLIELYRLRGLVGVCDDIKGAATQPDADLQAHKIATDAEEAIQSLFGDADQGSVTAGEAGEMSIQRLEAIYREGAVPGMSPTNMPWLSELCGGLYHTDLVIVAGRPGMGKSAFATSLARGIADNGHGVALFSFEMSEEQLTNRMLSEICYHRGKRIEYQDFRTGKVPEVRIPELRDANNYLSDLPIRIWSRSEPTVARVRSELRRWKRSLKAQGKSLDVVIVDYIGLMHDGSYKGNKVQEVAQITKNLKSMARELDVCVIALSQLSRGVESRDDKQPMLSDLRDSGAIEQDADSVLFLYRHAYYLKNNQPDKIADPGGYAAWQGEYDRVKNKCKIIMAKNRHGSGGARDVTAYMPCSAFSFDEVL